MIDLKFDADAHAYRLNGKSVPSVTEVLEPLQMLDRIPFDVLEAARIFGTQVHEACHLHNIDDLEWDSLDAEVAAYVRGYLRFLRESDFIVQATETRVASPKYGYAGTLDLYGELSRGSALIDIKSTATLPRTVGPQVAGYSQALEETTGQKTRRRYCLLLQDNNYKLIELKNMQDFSVFLSALNLWRWRNAST